MYCAYVTRIKNLRKHTNADRLMCGECFGNTVIVDLGTDPNQLGVYFPVDGKLGVEFAQKNDLLRRKDENGDPAGGYLDPEKRNIKALKLRGEKSDGLFLPISCLDGFTDTTQLKEGDTITMLNGSQFARSTFQRPNEQLVVVVAGAVSARSLIQSLLCSWSTQIQSSLPTICLRSITAIWLRLR